MNIVLLSLLSTSILLSAQPPVGLISIYNLLDPSLEWSATLQGKPLTSHIINAQSPLKALYVETGLQTLSLHIGSAKPLTSKLTILSQHHHICGIFSSLENPHFFRLAIPPSKTAMIYLYLLTDNDTESCPPLSKNYTSSDPNHLYSYPRKANDSDILSLHQLPHDIPLPSPSESLLLLLWHENGKNKYKVITLTPFGVPQFIDPKLMRVC